MSDFHNSVTRSDERIKKRKQNRILNSLIIVVGALIVFVGWNIFSGGSEEAGTSNQDNTEQTAGSSTGNEQDPEGGDDIVVSDPEEDQNSETDSTTVEDQQSDNEDQQDKENQDDKMNDEKKEEQKEKQTDQEVMQGPWEPVGTQQESYEPNYNDQSQNWKEMMQAILVPTGFSGSEITLWRLENDGGPKQAVGKYSLKGNPDKLYVVHIQWIDNKGWKPVNVEIKENPYS